MRPLAIILVVRLLLFPVWFVTISECFPRGSTAHQKVQPEVLSGEEQGRPEMETAVAETVIAETLVTETVVTETSTPDNGVQVLTTDNTSALTYSGTLSATTTSFSLRTDTPPSKTVITGSSSTTSSFPTLLPYTSRESTSKKLPETFTDEKTSVLPKLEPPSTEPVVSEERTLRLTVTATVLIASVSAVLLGVFGYANFRYWRKRRQEMNLNISYVSRP